MSNKIKLSLKDHSMVYVDAERGTMRDIHEHFSFLVPGYKFMPAYKNKMWDGKIRLLNLINGEITAGLFQQIQKYAVDNGYEVEVVESNYGFPGAENVVDQKQLYSWILTLGLPFSLHPYQFEAIVEAIQSKRILLISPTGSGKSLIIYVLIRWYLENESDKKFLLVVPTTSLVEQMYSDFNDYGFDSENQVHRVYSGKDKNTEKQIIISTWQSIYKMPPVWFGQFGAIIGDEVHGFKAKSLNSIMNKMLDTDYRIGTTGTLDGTLTNRMVLEGLFGPVYNVTTTKSLQDKGILSKIKIMMLVLRYSDSEREAMHKATYPKEIDFIVSHPIRNKYVTNLAVMQRGNTLVLFDLVDKHGKVLRDMIQTKVEEGRRVYYVSGEVDTSERESIRRLVETQTNCIIVASAKTFSTGINIRNLHNVIFASPSKSVIKVLQSIGRGLRKSDDGSEMKLYDIIDYIQWDGYENHTLRHSKERTKIYETEQFPYKLIKVDVL